MQLSEEKIELFYALWYSLLGYTNDKFKVLKDVRTQEDCEKTPFEELSKIRDVLYKNPKTIESFAEENPCDFSKSQLEIIESWKDFKQGRFYIFRYLKNYTVFLEINNDDPKAYGVLSLISTFEEMIGSRLPIMVEAVLLPFEDQIIYDSIFAPYSVFFGGGTKRRFNEAYRQAKARYGIITSLAFSEKKESDMDTLAFYLLSEDRRQLYEREIEKLINKGHSLLVFYHQEMGKIFAREVKKKLKKHDIIGWFGIVGDLIVASGTTRKELEKNIERIVPEKKELVYIFQMKKGK